MNKKLTKEEFLEKLKTDKDFSNRYGRKHITEGKMVLPPCHYGFQCYTRELNGKERWDLLKQKVGDDIFNGWVDDIVPFGGGLSEELQIYNIPTRAISLSWNQRSCDFPLGIPYNIASYGLLLEIIAKEVNMIPDELIGNLGDCHIYLNQIDGCKEQIGRELTLEERVEWMKIKNPSDTENLLKQADPSNSLFDSLGVIKKTREPFELPKLVHMKTDEFFKSLSENQSLYSHLDFGDFLLENYQSHSKIYFPLSN